MEVISRVFAGKIVTLSREWVGFQKGRPFNVRTTGQTQPEPTFLSGCAVYPRRLRLRKARGDNRICQVFDSPTLAESECQFSIGPVGVEDPKD